MARFILSPSHKSHPAPSPPSPAPRWRVVAVCGVVLAAAWIILSGAWNRWRQPSVEAELDARPVLIEMRKIGQLHTVSYAMKDVLHQDSEREPAAWASAVPGAVSLVHWATHNQVLVVAEGSVEAGVDLSHLSEQDVMKVKMPDGKTKLRVHLPSVTVYPPNVHVRVESNQAGPFWRDDNIVPKAQAEAGRRFLESAEKDNIRARARCNALQTLQQMQRTFGNNNIEFTFEEDANLAQAGR